jgi:Na+-driven multidrug efflux pump
VRDAMRVTAIFSGLLGAALALLLYVGRHWIASRFTADAAVIQAAVLYMVLVPISYGPGGVIAIANAAFNGLNRPFSAVIVSVSRTLLVNVPVAWIGGRVFGVPGIFLGICFSNLLVGVVSGLWVLSVTTPAKSLKPCTVS